MCGLENAIGGYGDYPDILSNLNFARDSYPRRLPYPVLFLLPNYALTRFARFAPDFWAWKSMEVRLESEIPKLDNISLELSSNSEPQRALPVPPERFDFLYHFLEQYRQLTLTRADLLNQLGDAYLSHVNYTKAEQAYQEALQLYQVLNHPLGEAQVLLNLAEVYYQQGRYREAEPLYVRSLQIRESKLGAEHPDVASSLNNLANLYQAQGRYNEAEPLYKRSLQIYESQLGAEHPLVATSLHNLAELYHTQVRYIARRNLCLRDRSRLQNSN